VNALVAYRRRSAAVSLRNIKQLFIDPSMSYRSPLQVARDIYGRYVSSEKHDSEEEDEKGEKQEGNDVSPVANGGLDQIQATEARDTTGPARTAARETLAEELEQMKKTMLELEARAVAAEQKNAKLREHSVYEVPHDGQKATHIGQKRPTSGNIAGYKTPEEQPTAGTDTHYSSGEYKSLPPSKWNHSCTAEFFMDRSKKRLCRLLQGRAWVYIILLPSCLTCLTLLGSARRALRYTRRE